MSLISNFFNRHKKDFNAVAPHRHAIIIAPDKFKGTMSAREVAETIASGISAAMPATSLHLCPMADGGDGTAEILACFENLQLRTTKGHNAMMEECYVTFYEGNNVCACDSSAIVGLAMLGGRQLNPWQATTHGLGEFILDRISRGIERIYIGIGGTATVDCGIGLLGALGARVFDVEGEEITERPLRALHLGNIYSIDFSAIDRHAIKNKITLLADVDVPLIADRFNSPHPSAMSYAPQKGVTLPDLPFLFNSFRNFRDTINATLLPPADEPRFQGAGGGLGYALHRILRCPCHSGAEYISEKYDLENLMPQASCIITGEGSFDSQSLQGKVVGTILGKAAQAGLTTVIVAGKATDIQTTQEIHIITTDTCLESPQQPLNHNTALQALKSALPEIISSLNDITSKPPSHK